MTHAEGVLAYIREHPGTTTGEMARVLGLQTGKAYVCGRKLEQYGLVRHETNKIENASYHRETRWWRVL